MHPKLSQWLRVNGRMGTVGRRVDTAKTVKMSSGGRLLVRLLCRNGSLRRRLQTTVTSHGSAYNNARRVRRLVAVGAAAATSAVVGYVAYNSAVASPKSDVSAVSAAKVPMT